MTPDRTFPVGLEEGPGGVSLVHALTLPGCVSAGPGREEALAAFPDVLAAWLHFLAQIGEPVPAADEELEISVDDWVRTDADLGAGESDALFEADLEPLTDREIQSGLHRLGELRRRVLAFVRALPAEALDRPVGADWTLRRALDELARAQWWTLTRLGASPMAEVPDRILGRLDTAMALTVERMTALPPERRDQVLELDGEVWTPRKVLRRLLWLEWSLGRTITRAADLLNAS